MTLVPGYLPYEPQLIPRGWDEDIWIVDGPEVAYSLWGLTLPCPTRMTIIRLPDGGLWVHSPVACTPDLVAAVEALGPVVAIVAPNSFHYTHLADWTRAFPQAAIFGVRGLSVKVRGIAFAFLENQPSPLWREAIDFRVIPLGSFTEAVFLHRASRTLIVTDLMQSFEADRIRNPLVRAVLRLGGATGPSGRPSIEIRLAGLRHRAALHQGVRRMLAWQPSGIILSHGVCFRRNAVREIERAFGPLR